MPSTNIIIQARMGSHRLPGKSLMPVWKEYSLLELILRRITKSKIPKKIILATSTRKIDDRLIPIAERCGVEVIRGSELDVLARIVQAYKAYPSDAIVRAAADNPLLDPEMIDKLITFFWENQPCDYASNLGPASGHPDGVGVEMVSAETLLRLDNEVKDMRYREHVVTYLHNNCDYISKLQYASSVFHRPGYRLDIDFYEDLVFVRKLVHKLPQKNAPYWTTLEIIRTLDRDPELLRLRKVRK
ncbi:MAG: NTP transferase domain-containing protein [Methanoregula sp.]